jgi:hypothetical protein
MFTQHRLQHNYEDSLDYYPTPGWATRALCEYLIAPSGVAWDPAAGGGHMVDALKDYPFRKVVARDITGGFDFLTERPLKCDWVITNPPFALGEAFALRAIGIAKTAMLVRLNFLESLSRYRNLFSKHPPSVLGIFTERIGFKYGVAEPNVPTATAYAWLVWDGSPQRIVWIPPCKARLSKPEDWR